MRYKVEMNIREEIWFINDNTKFKRNETETKT